MVKAFTNRLDIARDDDSVDWEYRPEDEIPKRPDMTSSGVPAAAEGGRGFVTSDIPPNPDAPMSTKTGGTGVNRPPSNTGSLPDYSAAGRDRFANMIKNQLGFDPVVLDPYAALDEAEKNSIPTIFNKFFRGKVIWADRDKLNSKQKKEWEEERLKFRAHVFNRVKEKQDIGMRVLKEGLDSFDRKAQEYSTMMSKIEDKMKKDMSLLANAPKEVGRIPPGGNQKTRHVWDSVTGQWVNTGEPWEGVSDAAILKQYEYENKALEGLGTGEKLDEGTLADINSRREQLRMPKLVEVETEAPSQESLFGVDYLWPDKKGKYEYYVEGSPELASSKGRRTSEINTGTTPTATARTTTMAGDSDAEITRQIKAQYPTAFKAVDGKWYYSGEDGQNYMLEIQ